MTKPKEAPRRVALADLLSGREAAVVAGVAYSHMRVLIARNDFPEPVRTEPSLWLRKDIADWLKRRRR